MSFIEEAGMQKGLHHLPPAFFLSSLLPPALIPCCLSLSIVLDGGALGDTVQGEWDIHNSNMVVLAIWTKTVAFLHSNSLILWARCW